MGALGVLRVLADRGDVVIVLEDDEETVSGFYKRPTPANTRTYSRCRTGGSLAARRETRHVQDAQQGPVREAQSSSLGDVLPALAGAGPRPGRHARGGVKMLADAGRNACLTGARCQQHLTASLHSSDPARPAPTSSPAARRPIAARRSRGSTRPPRGTHEQRADGFSTCPGDDPFYWIGLWTAATSGTYLGAYPRRRFLPLRLRCSRQRPMCSPPATASTTTKSVADRRTCSRPGCRPGWSENTVYWWSIGIVDTFPACCHQGAAPINTTTDAEVVVQKILAEVLLVRASSSVAPTALEVAQFV
mgnify:CR=1 FL=1